MKVELLGLVIAILVGRSNIQKMVKLMLSGFQKNNFQIEFEVSRLLIKLHFAGSGSNFEAF